MLRAAIVGCGKIAGGYDEGRRDGNVLTHAGGYSAHPGVTLDAVADSDAARLDSFRREWNINHAYHSHEELLEKSRPDILSICTWPDSHLAIARDAVAAGVKMIFCEKPLADTLSAATELAALCDRAGVLLAVNYHRRWDPSHAEIRQNIRKGALGDLQHFDSRYVRGVMNYGSHFADLVRYLVADIDWAWGTDLLGEQGPDSTLDGYFRTVSGVGCALSGMDRNSFDMFEYDLIGTTGRVRVMDGGFRIAYETLSSNPDYDDLPVFTSATHFKRGMWRVMFHGVEEVVRALNEGRAPACSGKDGVAAMQAVLAIRQSVASGRAVPIISVA